jgi:peroxiredoxin
MIERDDNSMHEVDALVGAYLAKRAARIDAKVGLARVRSVLSGIAPPALASARRFKSVILAAGCAAALLLAFLGGWHFSPVPASAMGLVQEVKRVHNLPLERCYVVETERLGERDVRAPFERIPRQVRIWTRGDRFWLEVSTPNSETPFVWGQDEDGSFWAVLDDHRGVRVSADQAHWLLRFTADVLSLNVDTLLDDVLRDCDLTEDSVVAGSGLTRIVHAEPRSLRTRSWLAEATLEIDSEARALRRLIIRRNRLGKPFAKVTFTLVDTRPASDDNYRLEGRLAQPVHIYEGKIEPKVRLELLRRSLGHRADAPATDEAAIKPENQPDDPKNNAAPLQMKAIDGVTYTPLAQSHKKASLLLFLLPDCPVCNAYAPEIKRIYTDYEPRGVSIFAVYADPDLTTEEASKHAKDYQLPCPVLLDPTHELVKRTGADMTPEAAVVGPDGKVLYIGRIDDLYVDYGRKRAQGATQHDLRNALDAVLAGKQASPPGAKPIGCHIPALKK